jgi:hypothetical protein
LFFILSWDAVLRGLFRLVVAGECLNHCEMEAMCRLRPEKNDRAALRLEFQAISMQFACAEVQFEGLEANGMF